MITQEQQLKRTPLYQEHLTLKAKMVAFGGWEMPVQYEGILAEYAQTRQAASLFDTSHMGEFIIEGDVLQSGLDKIVTMPLVNMPLKTSRYGLMLNEQGGTMDDLIVFRADQKEWFIVVNGATTLKDAEHMKKNLQARAVFKDISFQTGKLDLQGPLSRDVLKGLVEGIEKLDYFSFDYFDLMGEKIFISRTGYTGELGYEIFFPWGRTKELWCRLLEDPRVKPAGLGARDVLRLEMGYSLYGHELEENISPLEAGLNRFVDFNKNFIGKEALLKEEKDGLKKKLVGLLAQGRRSPRAGHKIYSQQGQEMGVISSGTFSPALSKGIGLGFVYPGHVSLGTKIYFGDEKKKEEAVVSARVFYKEGSLKK